MSDIGLLECNCRNSLLTARKFHWNSLKFLSFVLSNSERNSFMVFKMQLDKYWLKETSIWVERCLLKLCICWESALADTWDLLLCCKLPYTSFFLNFVYSFQICCEKYVYCWSTAYSKVKLLHLTYGNRGNFEFSHCPKTVKNYVKIMRDCWTSIFVIKGTGLSPKAQYCTQNPSETPIVQSKGFW